MSATRNNTSSLQRILAGAATLALLAGPAFPTWSIIAVNTRTKEVCVAGATCLSNFNLRKNLAVMRIGVGGGAAQAMVDAGPNRLIMWNGLGAGLSPSAILAQLAAQPLHQSRQYGIVNMDDAPVSFSGAFTSEANPGVVGVVGDFKYAIQGNILAGDEVVLEAEQAFLSAPGDLGQKVMAAMEAARAWGGDGRCSCSDVAPTSCQPLPPPAPFMSSLVGFFLIGRIGDSGASQCNSGTGCASGALYCALNVSTSGPEPVLALQQDYAVWRTAQIGRPDQVHSELFVDARALVADRTTSANVAFVLRDIDGVPLTHGGATVTLLNLSTNVPVTAAGPVSDHGDGSYSFSVRAKQGVGTDVWRVMVDDGQGAIALQPDITLRVDPLQPVHCGHDEASLSAGVSVPIVVHAGPPQRFRNYIVLLSNAGTAPGLPFAGTTLQLNSSNLLTASYLGVNTPEFSDTFGRLDRVGRAEARFTPNPNLALQLVGTRIDCAGVVFDPLGGLALAPDGFDIVP
ncbi:MAG: DUF1028 domain-containing protein [Planctomycetes bacterium]|nr:DUF1028 domain-containing protein [Planctomycetota bacterium]